jgi:hypothetical protein
LRNIVGIDWKENEKKTTQSEQNILETCRNRDKMALKPTTQSSFGQLPVIEVEF